MNTFKIGFIGTGNMGSALARAVAKKIGGDQVLLTDQSGEKAQKLAKILGASAVEAKTIISDSRYVFLGVKPQMLAALASEIKPMLEKRTDDFVLVSMAAGTAIERIESLFGKHPVIRIMPNTPVAVGQGMILYCTNQMVKAEDEAAFTEALSMGGLLDKLDEKLIDAASAVSGCGPAYVCLFMEALADGAVACGLPRDKALKYAEQTLLGTAKLALESGTHPAALKDAVCSPGGTTIMGVKALEDGAFRASAMNAVTAAYEKTLSLGK